VLTGLGLSSSLGLEENLIESLFYSNTLYIQVSTICPYLFYRFFYSLEFDSSLCYVFLVMIKPTHDSISLLRIFIPKIFPTIHCTNSLFFPSHLLHPIPLFFLPLFLFLLLCQLFLIFPSLSILTSSSLIIPNTPY